MSVQTERTEASEAKLVRAGADDDDRFDDRFADSTFIQAGHHAPVPRHPTRCIRRTVPRSQSFASFMVFESGPQPSCFFELGAHLVLLLLSPFFLFLWTPIWQLYYSIGGRSCLPPAFPCCWKHRWMLEKYQLMRRDLPKFKAKVDHLIGSLSPLAPPAIADDLQGLMRLIAVSYALWMPADWHHAARLFAAIGPRTATSSLLAILLVGAGVGIADARLIWDTNTTATAPLPEDNARLVLVTCIVTSFVLPFFILFLLWIDNGQSMGSPRVLLDFLAQHSTTQMHASHHVWIHSRPTTASEKAEARAGLRDLAARQQQSVAKTSAFFQALLLKVIVSATIIMNFVEILMKPSTPLYVPLAVLVVETIVLVALCRLVEKENTKAWAETLQVTYHVVEMRELILEHAEAVAAGPRAQVGGAVAGNV
jgi:hypothetical protein